LLSGHDDITLNTKEVWLFALHQKPARVVTEIVQPSL
jgi:hypothetical protein